MVFETLRIESCTGRDLVCLYCTSPKIAPTAQIRIPKYISVTPLIPPRPSNLTGARSGMLMSASLAATLIPLNTSNIRFQNTSLVLDITLLFTQPAGVLQDLLVI